MIGKGKTHRVADIALILTEFISVLPLTARTSAVDFNFILLSLAFLSVLPAYQTDGVRGHIIMELSLLLKPFGDLRLREMVWCEPLAVDSAFEPITILVWYSLEK